MKKTLPTKEVSILLPAYNEAWRIENCIKAVEEAVSKIFRSHEIIVTEEGSTDDTDKIVAKLQKDNPNLKLLHSPKRQGKGKAIKNALCKAKGDTIVFMDVDLATNLSHLPQIVQTAKDSLGLVIGSRYVYGAKVKRPLSRTLFSLSYNIFVRALFLDGVRDHQCGFKAMNHKFVEAVNGSVKSDGWFFDTELILSCKKLGFTLTEIGVEWSEKRKQKESKVRLLHDASQIGSDLLRFRLRTL